MLRQTHSIRAYLTMATATLAVVLTVACHKALPPDTICSYGPMPADAQIASGQGAIEVLASTDTYFTVRDGANKQIASGHVNALISAPAGDYQLVLNGSTHATSAQAKMLTKCMAGTVLVKGKTDEYYAVLDQAAQQLASAHLGAAVSLFPGTYAVQLNNTDVPATLQAGAILELKPGTINVDASTDEYYAVLNSAARQLASSHVGRAISLFPGSYTLRINNTDARANVRADESTNVAAGTVVVHGSTDEYFAVMNNAGTQLASTHLERALAFFPGTYNIKLNNTTIPETIVAGKTTEVKSGAVVLQGSTDEYYAIVDSASTQLASAHLGQPLSLMPGAYRAKLNNVAIPVQVQPSQLGEYQSGSLIVRTTGSDYYSVLDASGMQLASKQVNQPVSLLAGKYSVKLGNSVRPATIMAGQKIVLNW